MEGPINIVCVVDDHYTVLLAALIKSIETNHLSGEEIQLFIVDDGIKKSNKKNLEGFINPHKIKIIWINMADTMPSNFKLPLDKSTYPQNIYTRIFIPHFMPPTIKRVIFMDVDMLCLKDISELFNTDIGDNIIGAVQDSITTNFNADTGGGIENYKQLGLSGDSKYFNAGLMIIDIDKWLKAGISEHVMDIIKENIGHTTFPDQYGLNVGLTSKWFEIEKKWNSFADIIHDDPSLIHFFYRKPIYKSYFNQEIYRKLFYGYLDQTPWKNFKPIGEFRRYIKKLVNVMDKKLNLRG